MVVHLVKGRGAVLVDPEHGGSPQPLRPQAGADADGARGTRLPVQSNACRGGNMCVADALRSRSRSASSRGCACQHTEKAELWAMQHPFAGPGVELSRHEERLLAADLAAPPHRQAATPTPPLHALALAKRIQACSVLADAFGV